MHKLHWAVLVVTMATPAYAHPMVALIIEGSSGGGDELRAIVRSPPVDHAFAALHVALPDDPHVQIERSAVDVRAVGDVQLVTMTVTATSTAFLWQSAELEVSVPRTARVIGLALEQGGSTYRGEPMPAETAQARFIEATTNIVDPALLELDAHGRDYDRLRLSMYPVSTEQHVTVQLTIAVPRVDRLVVDLVGSRHEYGAMPPVAPTKADRALLAGPAITESRSLYVAPVEPTVTRPEIRNFFRLEQNALAGCNSGALADVVAHFTIALDGHLQVNSVTNASEQVASCLATTIERGHFHPGTAPLSVSYPIHLDSR